MQVINTYQHLPVTVQGASVALGNFDGVHPGHKTVIAGALQHARETGLPSGVIAFEPHTRQFFQPDGPPFRLTSQAAKTRVFESLGLDYFYALPFDQAMASLPAETFVMDVLVKGLGVRYVSVGADFKFGKMRQGDSQLLVNMGRDLGFAVDVFDMLSGQSDEAAVYSSTRVRGALREGDVRQASKHLGRLWSIEGIVEKGDQRGRTIGFPTLNIPMGAYLHPALGVYAVCVEISSGAHRGIYQGVANLGKRPTFDKKDVLLEVHLFDFAGDLYGAEVYVYFLDFLRPEQKFDGLDALKAQISKDRDAAQAIWAAEPAPVLIGD